MIEEIDNQNISSAFASLIKQNRLLMIDMGTGEVWIKAEVRRYHIIRLLLNVYGLLKNIKKEQDESMSEKQVSVI